LTAQRSIGIVQSNPTQMSTHTPTPDYGLDGYWCCENECSSGYGYYNHDGEQIDPPPSLDKFIRTYRCKASASWLDLNTLDFCSDMLGISLLTPYVIEDVQAVDSKAINRLIQCIKDCISEAVEMLDDRDFVADRMNKVQVFCTALTQLGVIVSLYGRDEIKHQFDAYQPFQPPTQ